MKIYAPEYCKDFRCIADKCRHSCCVDWEIDIDAEAYKKYEALKTDFGKSILETVNKTGDGAHFKLDGAGRCKNLDENGLCRIISELGKEYLCDICRLHPRFFNRVGGRIEMGLGLSCEEAVRLALTDTRPLKLVKIGENDEKYVSDTSDTIDFDVLSVRDGVISFIEEEGGTLLDKLSSLEKKYRIKTDFYKDEEWIDYLLSLEILDGEWREILKNAKEASQKSDISPYFSRLEAFFKYLVFRHVSTADSESSFFARLAFALLCVKLVKYLAEREENLTEARLFDIVRLFSSEIEYSEENTEDLIFELEAEQI